MAQKSDRRSRNSSKAEQGIFEIDNVIIRFAGDSGDGIQITGAMFSHDSALVGHDISTLPDFPAEIRAPAGTLAGVSSFQLNFSSFDVHTPGDRPDVLVALNPAALKVHVKDVKHSGTIILNHDAFDANGLKKAGYENDPREDGTLAGFQIYDFPITTMTVAAVESSWLSRKQAELSKNMFTLGIISWLYDRSIDDLMERIEQLFAKKNPGWLRLTNLHFRPDLTSPTPWKYLPDAIVSAKQSYPQEITNGLPVTKQRHLDFWLLRN